MSPSSALVCLLTPFLCPFSRVAVRTGTGQEPSVWRELHRAQRLVVQLWLPSVVSLSFAWCRFGRALEINASLAPSVRSALWGFKPHARLTTQLVDPSGNVLPEDGYNANRNLQRNFSNQPPLPRQSLNLPLANFVAILPSLCYGCHLVER